MSTGCRTACTSASTPVPPSILLLFQHLTGIAQHMHLVMSSIGSSQSMHVQASCTGEAVVWRTEFSLGQHAGWLLHSCMQAVRTQGIAAACIVSMTILDAMLTSVLALPLLHVNFNAQRSGMQQPNGMDVALHSKKFLDPQELLGDA